MPTSKVIRAFLDTEFAPGPDSGAERPELLSIALVASGGQPTLYMELSHDEVAARATRLLNDFVRKEVLAQFGQVEGAVVLRSEMPDRLIAWLNGLGSDTVEVAYDFGTDYSFVETLLAEATMPLKVKLQTAHVGYLLEDAEGELAAKQSWKALARSMGLAQHHALSDAFALEARFVAVHGA